MTPNAPGWWWRRHDGPPAYDIAANVLTVRGRMMWCAGSRLGGDVTDDGAWLGPIAPLGSVAPDVVARLVRDAWVAGRVNGYRSGLDAVGHDSHESRPDDDPADEWTGPRTALHAALTAAGADAGAVIAEVDNG